MKNTTVKILLSAACLTLVAATAGARPAVREPTRPNLPAVNKPAPQQDHKPAVAVKKPQPSTKNQPAVRHPPAPHRPPVAKPAPRHHGKHHKPHQVETKPLPNPAKLMADAQRRIASASQAAIAMQKKLLGL